MKLNLRVLTEGIWPLFSPTTSISLPAAPLNAFEAYRSFYSANNQGRRLTLLPSFGTAKIIARFYDLDIFGSFLASSMTSTREFCLQVSTYQMCILLLFNDKEKMSYEASFMCDFLFFTPSCILS